MGHWRGLWAALAGWWRRWRAGRRQRGDGISICLVVRDQADYVEGWFGQVLALAERLGPLAREVVVIDEASRDETPELVRLLARRYPGVQAVRWPRDGPATGSLEALRRVCGGAWVLVGPLHAAAQLDPLPGDARAAGALRRALSAGLPGGEQA